jgi:hypothetical protein
MHAESPFQHCQTPFHALYPLVRVLLLQVFFGCLSCLSFELDAMLSMASLKRANVKDSKHLHPTDSETLTNASWLHTHGPLLAVAH